MKDNMTVVINYFKEIREILGDYVSFELFADYKVYIRDNYIDVENEKNEITIKIYELYTAPEMVVTFNPSIFFPKKADIIAFGKEVLKAVKKIGNKKIKKQNNEKIIELERELKLLKKK